jgi:hypothetical protein
MLCSKELLAIKLNVLDRGEGILVIAGDNILLLNSLIKEAFYPVV